MLQDNSLRMWDLRPFAPANRCMKVFGGHQHSFERNLLRCSWSPENSKARHASAWHPAVIAWLACFSAASFC